MANYNILFSPTGGTKKVADILASNLFKDFASIDLCREINAQALCENDICIVSVPSYGGRVPHVAIKRLQMIKGNGAKAILNCVYGNREWEDTLTELQDTLEDIGFKCIAAIAAVAEHSIFRQFATGRPNDNDKTQLIEFCQQIRQRLNSNAAVTLTLSGNHRTYKVFNGSPLKPMADANCTGCDLCAKECPVGAIDIGNPKTTDKETCISCMRCISICPKHARSCDARLIEEIGNKLSPVLGGYKNNHLFL